MQVAELVRELQASGADKQERLLSLQTLRQVCAEGTNYIDAIFAWEPTFLFFL